MIITLYYPLIAQISTQISINNQLSFPFLTNYWTAAIIRKQQTNHHKCDISKQFFATNLHISRQTVHNFNSTKFQCHNVHTLAELTVHYDY